MGIIKIIHSADQHLDSGMSTHLSEDKAVIRRAEVLNTFANMVDYAVDNDVKAILLSGDLFDTPTISAAVQNTVTSLIKNNPDIIFYYLKGNHDNRSFLTCLNKLPDNLKIFDDKWTRYHLTEKIAISGIELCESNFVDMYDELELAEEDINIAMLHGQVSSTESAIDINVGRLAGKNIDYLALGHIHSYDSQRIDGRGLWCYSGCLEGRGFDEPGEKGFVLLEIDEDYNKVDYSFVPFANRKIEHFEVDISGAESDVDIEGMVSEVLLRNQVSEKSIVDIRLVGSVDEALNVDIVYLTKRYENRYFYIRFKNRTQKKVDYTKYINEVSLRGEFIRGVLSDDKLSEEDKNDIISAGLKALKKEDMIAFVCR